MRAMRTLTLHKKLDMTPTHLTRVDGKQRRNTDLSGAVFLSYVSDLVLQPGPLQGHGQRVLRQSGCCSLSHSARQRCQSANHFQKGRKHISRATSVKFTPLLRYSCIYFSQCSFWKPLLSILKNECPNLETWIWVGWVEKLKTRSFMRCISYFSWHKPYKWFSYRICCNAWTMQQ